MVTAGEVQYAVENLAVNSLLDLRRRTRIGMGTCQGELCACRAAGLLQRFNITTPAQSLTQLSDFFKRALERCAAHCLGRCAQGK